MKKVVGFFVLIMFLAAMWTARAPQGYAQGIQTPVPVSLPDEQDVVSFSTLGVADIVMHGPFDSATVQFATPSSWVLQEGAIA